MPGGEPLAGVVLAGGASTRMGRDKATMPHPSAGVSMVEHTVAVLAARCEPVFVIAAAGQELPALRARIVRDRKPGAGPLVATGTGLREAAAAGRQWAFVCAVDMPHLSVDLIGELAGHLKPGQEPDQEPGQEPDLTADVVLPWDGRDHYLAGVYRTALFDRIDALVGAGGRSMRALTDTVNCARVQVSSTAALANVNEPSDLR